MVKVKTPKNKIDKGAEKKQQPVTKVTKTTTKTEAAATATADRAAGIWKDARFQHLLEDPRFRGVPKAQRKVKIDKRFEGMFTDDKFKVKYTVDKYGRRVNKSNTDDLRKYYELDENSEDDDDEEKTEEKEQTLDNKSLAKEQKKSKSKTQTQTNGKATKSKEKVTKKNLKKSNADDNDDDDDGDDDDDEDTEAAERRAEELAISRQSDDDQNDALDSDSDDDAPKSVRERLVDPQIDYARGEGRLMTDSSSDDESTDDDEEGPELQIDHVWGELDAVADTTEESTRRLALCNMDWDRIRAEDIMILLTSFLPPGGSVLSVTIYPSEFGKERMAEEEIHGPTELVGMGKQDNNDYENSDSDEDSIGEGRQQDSDAEEGDDFHMEKLRQYQLNRLRYYYAVIECDSVATADKLYQECDGIEYESSATRVDLRYIPDDTTFVDDEPRDVCTELPNMSTYKPRQFTTTALQQAKVDLTWDETALERRELGDKLSSGKLDGISDKDLRQIVAYSSEEDDIDDDDDEEEENALQQQQQQKKDITKPNESKHAKQRKETKTNNKKQEKLKESISKYQALLTEINDNEKKKKNERKYEMEMSWDVTENTENKNEAAESQTKTKPELTPIEKVLQKRSEKNKKRKEERRRRKLEAAGIDPDAVNTNDSADELLHDGIDMNDPYFAEEFANGDFIEPTTKSSKQKKSKKKQPIDENEAAEQEENERRAKELELLLDDDDDLVEAKQHFSLDKILKSEQESATTKRKRRKLLKKSKTQATTAADDKVIEDDFRINTTDNRFGAIYTSHMFNIDPTDSHFKKTKGMEEIIQEKLKRREKQEMKRGTGVVAEDATATDETQQPKRAKKQLENSMLVKSLKRKIQQQQKTK